MISTFEFGAFVGMGFTAVVIFWVLYISNGKIK